MLGKLIHLDPAKNDPKRWWVAISETSEHYLCIQRYADGFFGSSLHAAPKTEYTLEGDDLV